MNASNFRIENLISFQTKEKKKATKMEAVSNKLKALLYKKKKPQKLKKLIDLPQKKPRNLFTKKKPIQET